MLYMYNSTAWQCSTSSLARGSCGGNCRGHCNSRLCRCGRAKDSIDDMKDGLAGRHISKDDVCWIASGSLDLDLTVAGLGDLQATFMYRFDVQAKGQ